MKRRALRLTLLEDAVFSDNAATAGGHRAMDYLPGLTLLGAAAARLYRTMDADTAYQVFHSGAMRFGNGLPLAPSGQLAWPLPLGWYEAKKQSAIVQGQLQPAHLVAPEQGGQCRPLRDGFVTRHGEVVRPKRRIEMKTAIDPATGRAKEGHLFGYECLAAGQTFLAELHADDALSDDLLNRVVQSLTRGPLRLGRSRSAQYGLVQCEAVEPPPAPSCPNQAVRAVTLWLLSDLALLDAWGQPTLTPSAPALGLPADGSLDPARSFVRAQAVSPFNGRYALHELERPVLQHGSVLHFDFDQPVPAATLAALADGVGLHRQAGLGRVWVNPPLLAQTQPAFAPLPAAKPNIAMATPDHPLAAWLQAAVEQEQSQGRVDQRVESLRTELQELYQSARRLEGAAPGVAVGPSRSQWGRVMTAAKQCKGADDLRRRLFEGDDCICNTKAAERDWVVAGMRKGNKMSFTQWLQQALQEAAEAEAPRLVALLARRAQEMTRQENPR